MTQLNLNLTDGTVLTNILRTIFPNEVWDDSVERTAERVLSLWSEYVPPQELSFAFTTFPAKVNQMIVVKDIEFSSLCAHHLLPFTGFAHVGYVPNELMVGLSKIPRLVDFWARRPTVQEYLTANIASDLKHRLQAMGVAVVIEARHTCMVCRGVRKHSGAMVTSEMRGIYLTAQAARTEFLSMIGRDRL
jgi:GTP cyclohydrolase I